MKGVLLNQSMNVGTIIFCLLVLSLSITNAAEVTFQPVFKPELKISKTSDVITIDGMMSELAWSTAAKVSNFSERNPGDLTKPSVETEVYVTYDNKNLFVFFKCFDDPNSIRATNGERDNILGDDLVTMDIDTYGDASSVYELGVNAYGIQWDLLWSATANTDDQSFDMLWESAGQKTSDGYYVEIAIPFSSLRYPNKDIQSWRINFTRFRPRESDFRYTWAARDRNNPCVMCQLGTLNGLKDIRQKKSYEILPTFVGFQAGQLNDSDKPTNSFDNGNVDGEFSASGKYTPSSDVVIEVAINPDFSQIEADATQIDVNSPTTIYYSEKRPYFQEGSDLFQTIWGSFYSRTVNDPQVTAKLTARLKSNSFAFLTAVDENSPYMIPFDQTNLLFTYPGKSYVNVLRGLHKFGGNSQLGFMLTDRRFQNDGSNTLYTLDGNIYLTEKLKTRFQFIGTHTKEPNDITFTSEFEGLTFDKGTKTAVFDGESFNGQAMVSDFVYSEKNLYLFGSYKYQSRAYRTETGFDPTINFQATDFESEYYFYFENNIFEKIVLHQCRHDLWNLDGRVLNQAMHPSMGFYLRFAQTYISPGVSLSKEYWQGKNIEDITKKDLYISMQPSKKLSYTVYLTKGDGIARYVDDGNGGMGVKSDEFTLSSTLNLKPIDKLTIENTYDYLEESNIDTDELYFKGFIARSKFQFQANKELTVRLVLQYNDFSNSWNIDPLFTYRLNSFTVFYFGSTFDYNQYEIENENRKDWVMSSRQFFMKLQYLVKI